MSLTREQILAADDSRIEAVDVPEWGGQVFVRMMSGAERDAYERAMYDKSKLGQLGENARAHLASLTVCDEGGNLLFSQKDVEALGRKSSAALERVVKVSQRLNKLESVEDAAKN